jgi:hypothetical protein
MIAWPGMRALLLFTFISIVAATHVAAVEDRYVATWADGNRTTVPEIEDWGAASGNPSLGGRRLFDGSNPARTIIDTAQPRQRIAAPYIELPCGDRLSGRVIEFQDGHELAGVPAYFVAEPSLNLDVPNLFARPQIRIRAAAVRRIVAQPIPGQLTPNSLQTVDGHREQFRSWRWRTNGIDVLTSSGVKHVGFRDLAAIEFDQPNTWDAWFQQLAVLSPGLESPLIRMELSDGTQLTTSRERLRPVTVGGEGPDHWFHLCQPAWSLDLLAVSHRQVRLRTIFDATQTPLSAIEPVVSRGQGIILPAPTRLHSNESLAGGALRSAGGESGWGFAVHAPYEFAFDLPRSARRFRTRLALDPTVGDGGCAGGRLEYDGKSLFDSPLLIGSGRTQDSGWLSASAGRLTLIADAAAQDRPSNADPLDIRDDLNWLEPLVEHDPVELQRAVRRHFASVHPGLAAWRFDPAEAGQWRLVNRLDDIEPTSCGFRQLIELNGSLTLTRQVSGSPQSTLRLIIGRSVAFHPVNATIWFHSNRVLRETLPEWSPTNTPLEIDVPTAGVSGSLIVTCRLAPIGESAMIDWRGLAIESPANEER